MGQSALLCLKSSTFVLSAFLIFSSSLSSGHSRSPLLGVHPLDEEYYAAEVIKCKDGSRSFIRDRLNDDFCDCLDGTDEPGTAACPRAKFYCRNAGSTPKFIFSSQVNDKFCGTSILIPPISTLHILRRQKKGLCSFQSMISSCNGDLIFADCCDGSDEYEGKTRCPNTCIMGGNIEFKHDSSITWTSNLIETAGSRSAINNPDSMIEKLKGLKLVILLQATLISCLLIIWISRRRAQSQRRRAR